MPHLSSTTPNVSGCRSASRGSTTTTWPTRSSPLPPPSAGRVVHVRTASHRRRATTQSCRIRDLAHRHLTAGSPHCRRARTPTRSSSKASKQAATAAPTSTTTHEATSRCSPHCSSSEPTSMPPSSRPVGSRPAPLSLPPWRAEPPPLNSERPTSDVLKPARPTSTVRRSPPAPHRPHQGIQRDASPAASATASMTITHTDAPRAYPDVHHLTAPLRAHGRSTDNAEIVNMWAGQTHQLATDEPAAILTLRLAAEASQALDVAAARLKQV